MENITPLQLDILQRLRRRAGFRVEWDRQRGVVSLLRGADLGHVNGDEPSEMLGAALALFGPPTSPSWLRLRRDRVDDLGWRHIEYQQVIHTEGGDLDLYRSILAVHVLPSGEVCSVQSSCYRDVEMAPFDRFDELELHRRLVAALDSACNASDLADENAAESMFPMMAEPLLVVHPWKGEFRPTYVVHAYAPSEAATDPATGTGGSAAELGKVLVDARTGERFLFAPACHEIKSPDIGSGLSVTPLEGGFQRRELNISKDSSDGAFYLEDSTLARKIITYNAANDEKYDTLSKRRDALFDDSLPISRSDSRQWDELASGSSLEERTASRQPEVDLHHHLRGVFEWYYRLAGRIGWDNGEFPEQPIRGIAHVRDRYSQAAHMRRKIKNGEWIFWLEFPDGDAETFTYSSGSRFIVAHEYQHAVTDHFFRSYGHPDGLESAETSWFRCFDEGIADAFAGFITGDWRPCQDISPVQRVLRNLAFPRDTDAEDPLNLDHFADRAVKTFSHARGTILAHAASLMAAGGVHQRASRRPHHIAVASLGNECRDGVEIPKAARVFYRALAYNFCHHGALTGEEQQDETLFAKFSLACVDAAADLYGEDSREHRGTARAFYAVGLYPSSGTYGPDIAMLPPASQWVESYPYVGLHSSAWSSRDLFINNGDPSDLNPLPGPHENTVHCRVRNYGDEPAQDVEVVFEYALLSIVEDTTWYPVVDALGNKQVLSLGTLEAGQVSFADSAQDAPPEAASVKWCLPPVPDGQRIRHYCLRARVSSGGVLRDEVRSVFAYLPYDPAGHTVTMLAVNPTNEDKLARIEVDAVLPNGWVARLPGGQDLRLAPGEQREIDLEIAPARGVRRALEVPLDGQLIGRIDGPVCGEFRGLLTGTTVSREVLPGCLSVVGRLSAIVESHTNVHGHFKGTVNRTQGLVSGTLSGDFDTAGRTLGERADFQVRADLRPWRGVGITQSIDGRIIGGIVLEVQDPAVAPCRPA